MGVGRRHVWLQKCKMGDPVMIEMFLILTVSIRYPACDNVLWFCKALPLGDGVKAIQDLSVLFLTNACESTII